MQFVFAFGFNHRNQPMDFFYEQTLCLSGHDDTILALCFSPDGALLASAGLDGKLFIWTTTTGAQLHDVIQSEHGFSALLWLDNSSLLSGKEDGTALLITLAKDDYSTCLYLLHDEPVECLAMNRGGTVASGAGITIQIFTISDTRRVQVRKTLRFDDGSNKLIKVTSLHWADSLFPNALLVTYLNHGVVVWNMETSDVIYTIPLDTLAGDAALSADHRFLAISNISYGFDVYDIVDKKHVKSLKYEDGSGRCLPVAFIHGGNYLIGGSSIGSLAISHLGRQEPINYLDHPENPVILSIASHYDSLSTNSIIACGSAGVEDSAHIWVWRGQANWIPSQRRVLIS
ncbi:WD40-repeat-containing domain protein [Crepidotus variabilis]|uniref:WD40-repeat-containing domain protein n=1 Tax=Crepidotus variabilis TaxID=179855 RepID=A0A9P6E125_9AGAR|nr:WD40-repeat-containing domain protein [Crepidotus variabilis]